MNMNSYYVLAANDYLYLQKGKETGLYNNIAVHAQQVVEKYLKHMVETFCVNDPEANNALKSHNLLKIYKVMLNNGIDLDVQKAELALMKDFYFNARYPGDDFLEVSKDEAEDCLELVERIKSKTEQYLAEHGYCSKCGAKLLSTGRDSACSCES